MIVLLEGLPHGRSDQVLPAHDERMDVGVSGFRIGRNPDSGRKGTGLMLVIQDLRKPLPGVSPVHVLGFDEIPHERITIVVMAHIFVI